jgi:hypothetical protein
MKQIIRYIKQYTRETDKKVIAFVSLFAAIIIFVNYTIGLDQLIRKNNPFVVKLFFWYIVFLSAFAIPYAARSVSISRFTFPISLTGIITGTISCTGRYYY